MSKAGVPFTPDQAKVAINAYLSTYPDIARYLNECADSVLSPGYIQGLYGRYRMAGILEDEAVVASYQRQFKNWRIQNAIGDAMSMALINFSRLRSLIPNIDYRILLSIHDAILVSCPGPCAKDVIEKVFKIGMTDGLVLPGINVSLPLGTPDIYLRWGEKPDPTSLEEIGVAREYCGFKD